jgi:hypothetical protein
MKTKVLLVSCVVCGLVAGLLGGCGTDGDVVTAGFKGILYDRISNVAQSDITVKAVDHDTGEILPGFETVTKFDGSLSFDGLPAGKIGFLAVKVVGEFIDTYQFAIDSDSQDEKLWIVDLGTYQIAPPAAGITIDPTKGLLAGNFYWVDEEGEEIMIGCATVASDTGGEVRYFKDNGLPANTVANDPLGGLDETNRLNATFLVANMEPEAGTDIAKATVTGYNNMEGHVGEPIGSTDLFAFGRDQTITINNLYADTAEHPTLSCEN